MVRNSGLAATQSDSRQRESAVVELSAVKSAAAPAGPDILRRAAQFSDSFDRITAGEINPFSIVIEKPLGPVEAVIDGRRTIMFGTNSYLGLNFHPDCVRVAGETLARYGTGSTASRVAAGNHALHVALEQDIEKFYGCSQAVVYSTGFMANLGVISGLAREGDAVFLDAHSHASIFDAARLSGAAVRSFAHNDPADVERLFQESRIPAARTIVVLESVYSVWGDVGDLKSIAAAAKRRGAIVVVDEAHGMGIYGAHGRGIVEHLGLEDDVDVIVGTFSKSVGVIGGFSVTRHAALRSLRLMARPYLYTASLPLSIVASAREALRIVSTQPELRETLWENAGKFHAGLHALGLDVCSAVGPVGSIRLKGVKNCHNFWKGLLARGVYVNMLVPPATPNGEVVLRFSVSAAHTPAHIETALAAFGEVSRSLENA
jgi:8-amino-7-oxononanoate synthase